MGFCSCWPSIHCETSSGWGAENEAVCAGKTGRTGHQVKQIFSRAHFLGCVTVLSLALWVFISLPYIWDWQAKQEGGCYGESGAKKTRSICSGPSFIVRMGLSTYGINLWAVCNTFSLTYNSLLGFATILMKNYLHLIFPIFWLHHVPCSISAPDQDWTLAAGVKAPNPN